MDEVEFKKHLAELFDEIFTSDGQPRLSRNEAAVKLWGLVQAYHEPGPNPASLKHKELFYRLVKTLGQRETTKYTPGRSNKLKARLKAFSPDELDAAAKEMANNEYMVGINDSGRRYATIDYLLRNDEQIDNWLEAAGGGEPVDLNKLSF